MTSLPNLPVTKISEPVKTFRLVRVEREKDVSEFLDEEPESLAIENLKSIIHVPISHKQPYGSPPDTPPHTSEWIVNKPSPNLRMDTAGSVKKNKEFGTVPLNTIPLLKKRPTMKNANRKVTEVKLLAKKFLRIL